MLEFGGVFYYIDIDALDKAITPKGYKPTDIISSKEKKTVTGENGEIIGEEILEAENLRGKEIDVPKYEIIRTMIEVLIDYNDDDSDTTLGADRALSSTPLSYKLAFNTLYNYGILKEKE